jgi:16S rRNA (uracil1498-N3)-methyltransferase
MSTQFYIFPEDVQADRVLFRADEARHLCVVLRKRAGDVVTAVDGQGNEFEVMLEQKSPSGAAGRIIRRRRRSREPIVQITLAQALLKGAKMEQIIQKGTELGVVRFLPMMTEHSVLSPRTGSVAKKEDRWRKIAIGAMKQSLRSFLPEVAIPIPFAGILRDLQCFDTAVMATLAEGAVGLRRALDPKRPQRQVLLLVGPEGGFSAEEIRQARETGVQLVTLGPRRLRAFYTSWKRRDRENVPGRGKSLTS